MDDSYVFFFEMGSMVFFFGDGNEIVVRVFFGLCEILNIFLN